MKAPLLPGQRALLTLLLTGFGLTNLHAQAQVGVGIGTTTPYSRLSLGAGAGNSSVSRIANYEETDGTYFYGTGLVQGDNAYGLGLWGSSGNSRPWDGSGGAQPHLFVESSGNVGVGTVQPAYKLHVAGSMAGGSLDVTGTIVGSRLVVGGGGLRLANMTGPGLRLAGLTSAGDVNGHAVSNGLTLEAAGLRLGGTLSQATYLTGLGASTPLGMYATPPQASDVATLGTTLSNWYPTSFTSPLAWQSFQAGRTGALVAISVKLGAPVSGSYPVTMKLYAGTGTGGALLATVPGTYVPVVVGSAGGEALRFALPPAVVLTSGQTYTVQVSGLVAGSAPAYWAYSTTNPIASGVASLNAGSDFLLQTDMETGALPVLGLTNAGVGIGTAAPQAPLHVVGAARFESLGGSGIRMLTAAADGTLGTAPLPTAGTDAQQLSKSGSTISLTNGGSVTDADNQVLSLSSSGTQRTLSLSGGNSTVIDVADNDNSSTNEAQTLSKTGSTVTLSSAGGSGGGSFTDADGQTLSLSGSSLSISGGNAADLSSLRDNLGSHTATQNLNLGANQLVGNGGSTGLSISSTGNVGVGTAASPSRLSLGTAGGAGNNALTRLANYEDANGQYFYGTGLVKNSANAYGLGLWGGSGNVQPWNGTEGTPAHLFVGSNGYVGIGTTVPAYPLDVNGQVRATNVAVTSDARFKQNIRPLGAALAAVQALRGVRYYWRRAEFPQKHFTDQEQLGFLAQEVEKVLPQAVQQDAQGYYAVDYQKVIPLLVEAIKELSAKLDAAQAANADLRQQAAATAALEARVRALEASLSGQAQR